MELLNNYQRGNLVKILVFGKGFIGKEIYKYFDCNVSDRRIKYPEDVKQEINKYQPDIVINCIGKVGEINIDWCEDHQDETFFSNVQVPLMIDKSCSDLNIKMVHISSGCIYNGGEFNEEDLPNFFGSTYSRSKILCQEGLSKNVLQLRIRMPICSYPDSRNFLTKILRYDKLIDVNNSITVMPDFLNTLKRLINNNSIGIFNVVNPRPISHSQIINIYNEYANIKKEFNIFSIEEMERITAAKRSNCRLSTHKLESLGIILEDSHVAIRRCVQQYVKQENLCVI